MSSQSAIFLLAPPGTPIAAWLSAAGFALTGDVAAARAIVFTPHHALAAAAHPALPRVACLPVGLAANGGWLVAPDATEFTTVLADAYAGDARALAGALVHALSDSPAERHRGPLRITWLGSLGEIHPAASPPLGTSIPLIDSLTVGRDNDSDLCLRSGAHSDQNTVARRHAVVERAKGGARVRDLCSTNGTWFCGRKITEVEIGPGQEIAVAATHRVRLDGSLS